MPKILPFKPIERHGPRFDKPEDHALTCSCGSVRWCIRKDGKIECYNCGDVLEDISWLTD